MAKYEVECEECGRKYDEVLYGPMKDREWHLSHDTHMCPECEAKVRAQRHAEENAKAAETNQAAGLPAMSGSQKQIAWAESIRCKAMQEIADDNRLLAKVYMTAERYTADEQKKLAEAIKRKADGKEIGKARHIAAIRDMVMEQIAKTSSASWWIDNRSDAANTLVKATLAALIAE